MNFVPRERAGIHKAGRRKTERTGARPEVTGRLPAANASSAVSRICCGGRAPDPPPGVRQLIDSTLFTPAPAGKGTPFLCGQPVCEGAHGMEALNRLVSESLARSGFAGPAAAPA